jgi:lactate dehydrogenase-like 2-hydroxyacid dehydrogenase
MAQHRIVVTRRPPGDSLDWLAPAGDVWVWQENRPIPREALFEQIETATGLYCMLTDSIDRSAIEAGRHLVGISQMAVGVDNIDLAAATERCIPVGHTPGVLTETTADLAFALMMAAARRLQESGDHVRAGAWQHWDPGLLLGADVGGTTLGIIGMGRIGKAVARRAAGFGMRVLYTKPRRDRESELGLRVEYRELADLLAESDHVMVLAALTSETRGLIGYEQFAAMKPTATFVNAARGPIVDTAALLAALEAGEIMSAALDVTDPEPIPSDHPLVTHPACLVVPHIGSATVRTRVHMAEMAAGNLLAALSGEPMAHCANPEVYGRD